MVVLRYASKDQLLSKLPLNHIHMKPTVSMSDTTEMLSAPSVHSLFCFEYAFSSTIKIIRPREKSFNYYIINDNNITSFCTVIC